MMLDRLTQCFGVSGRESKVLELITEFVKPYADSITTDALGNLIILKEGQGQNKKKIMCCAHIDEIGFAVTKIMDDGFLRVRAMGGVSAFISHCSRVQFENGVVGTIVVEDDVMKLGENDITKLFIDIGAKDKEDALKYVKVGDMACYMGEFAYLQNGRVVGKSFDNRASAYVLIESLKKLEAPYNDIYCVFTVQEELGLRGATVVSERIRPDIGVVLDVTNSFDIPSRKEGNPCMGQGAAIKVLDHSVVCDRQLIDIMIKLAEENSIPYQLDVEAVGGTDGGAINTSYQGVRIAGISVPTRYMHSPVSVVDMNDVKACIELLTKFCLNQL
jgi:putative aminopeptidase FrvX